MSRRKYLAPLMKRIERPSESDMSTTMMGVASSIAKDGSKINSQTYSDGEIRDLFLALPYGISSSGLDGIRVQVIINDNNNNTVVGVIDKNKPSVKSGCITIYDKSGSRIELRGNGDIAISNILGASITLSGKNININGSVTINGKTID